MDQPMQTVVSHLGPPYVRHSERYSVMHSECPQGGSRNRCTFLDGHLGISASATAVTPAETPAVA